MERNVKRLLRNGAFIFTAVLLIFSGVEAAPVRALLIDGHIFWSN